MKQMSSIDRMRSVFSGEMPDCVPFFPTIYTDHACLACGYRFEDALINPSLGTEHMLEAALKYQADGVRFCLGPELRWFHDKVVREENGKLVQCDKKTGKQEGFYDVKGGGKFIPCNPQSAVNSLSDVNMIEVMFAKEYLEKGCLETVKECIVKAHEKRLFTVGMCSSQTINFMVEKMGSSEIALMSFYDNPKLACALIDKAVEISIEKVKAFIKVGIDCIYIGDSYASASVISPDIYERFCVPAYKTIVEEIHLLGVLCYKHCCGNYNPLLKSLPSIGIDAMDGIDPTSGMTVKHTKDEIGSKITLMGGISCLTLLNGTSDQVYEEAMHCVQEGKPGGRYVLGSGCAVPPNTPCKNIVAARKAKEDHGKY